MTRSALLVLAFGLALALAMACKPAPTPAPTSAPTATPTARVTPAQPLTATPSPAPTRQPAASPLFLDVMAPGDESVLNAAAIDVKGQTTPDAVVTVNAQVVDVDANGEFTAHVQLDEGPNVIELLASDFGGNQVSRIITVIYVAG